MSTPGQARVLYVEPPFEPAEGVPLVWTALAAIASAVMAVPKSRKQTEGPAKYSFRGIDDVTDAVHPHFAEHGVLPIPFDVDVTWTEVARGQNKTIWRHYQVRTEWTFIGPAGDRLVTETVAEALTPDDKGLGIARSYGLKDLLLRVLTLPTGDPASDSESRTIPEATQERPRDLNAEAVAAGFDSEEHRKSQHQTARAWARDNIPEPADREPLKGLFGGRWPLTATELAEWVHAAEEICNAGTKEDPPLHEVVNDEGSTVLVDADGNEFSEEPF